MLSAVFFPVDPEADTFNMVQLANKGLRKGLLLYTNGRQLALLPKPINGWALFGSKVIRQESPCA